LCVKLCSCSFKTTISTGLGINLGADNGLPNKNQHRRRNYGSNQHQVKLTLARSALYLPMRQQVNAYHQSNLRMAKPQAIISAGASAASCCDLNFEPNDIALNGLATMVLT